MEIIRRPYLAVAETLTRDAVGDGGGAIQTGRGRELPDAESKL